ncbi:hypothetical protein QAD02_001243 [Eretmocerus hayati]|uniref:Uncharacterized protein n=1 Tax=Eretmocerus hayati TaxID=131215 RepID=A0ACC2NFG1_9HYME|nr:hypothetical protein QAD02_001243 [Eretmocerus hayati]
MVRLSETKPTVRTAYYLKHGQTLKNTKVSERALALIVPKSIYERFKDVPESEKQAVLAEQEAKILAARKKASHEMTKTWTDTAQNIEKRRREEILSRRKVEEAARLEFAKEMQAKKAVERAEIVKQAKELLLYKRPACRLINRSLLVSEVLRELEQQIKFKDSIKDAHKKIDDDWVKHVLEDIQKFRREEAIRLEAKTDKTRKHKKEMEKQIQKRKKELEEMKEFIRKAELEEMENMSKEIQEIKENELKEALRKKEELNKMFVEAIEEKKVFEAKLRQEEEFQQKTLKIYNEMKREMDKTAKEKLKLAREKRRRVADQLAKRIGKKLEKDRQKNSKEEEERGDEAAKKIEEQRKAEELRVLEEKKQKKEKARIEMERQMKIDEEQREKRKKEEQELNLWETLQRYKRDEFNKQWNLEQLQKEKEKKIEYGRILQKQMEENEARKQKILAEEDDSKLVKEMVDKANERILTYGEKVLNESRGVRPLYPIIKTIEQFKKEAGLIPLSKADEENNDDVNVPKKKKGRQIVCKKTIDDADAYYFA